MKKSPFILVRGHDLIVEVTAREDNRVSEDTLRGAFQLEQNVPIGLFAKRRALEYCNDDKINFSVGTPGSKRGYSGAPVLSYDGCLTGIILGSTAGLYLDSTIRECLESAAEQKYDCILGLSVIVSHYDRERSDSAS